MRKTFLLAGTFAMVVAGQAFAQEGSYSQTLDEQLQRVKEGKPAVPAAGYTPQPDLSQQAPAAAQPVRSAANNTKEWPSGAAPAMAAPVRGPSGEMIDSEGSGAIPPLPLTTMQANGVRYVTGGIGDEEEAELKSLGGQYNLQLLMTAPRGEFISEANVAIADASGKNVLTVADAGPFLYVALPAGSYTVDVNAPGGRKSMTVKVPARGAARPQMRVGE